jgi:hypothetical protein
LHQVATLRCVQPGWPWAHFGESAIEASGSLQRFAVAFEPRAQSAQSLFVQDRQLATTARELGSNVIAIGADIDHRDLKILDGFLLDFRNESGIFRFGFGLGAAGQID